MTAPEKGRWYWVRNWLHYHWVYLVIAAVVLWVGISWLANALHWGETLPDYQIAYVGKNALPEIPPRKRYRGISREIAAALALAMDTARIALAPSLDLSLVPSASIIALSMA